MRGILSVIPLCVLVGTIDAQRTRADVGEIDKQRILNAAVAYLKDSPQTITAFHAERSAGGPHDFYSEGDYWWPDSTNPDGPYVQRDGVSNPGNFTKHREAMVRLSRVVSALTAAFTITGQKEYADHATEHLNAWFVDSTTMMSPHLLYAQAIKGRVTGRGIGIIDAIHLVEVARSAEELARASAIPKDDVKAVRSWFRQFLSWLTTHAYGVEEREALNNHGTWWVAQVAAYARFVGDEDVLSYCRTRFKDVLVPGQIALDGSFPLELKRTKPYNYSIFNLDGMTLICQVLSTPSDYLWEFTLPDGRGVRRSVEFMFPFLKDKSLWPFPADVMYFEHYPARSPSLLFAGVAYGRQNYLELWKKLEPDPEHQEVQRNFPVRQPMLWLNEAN